MVKEKIIWTPWTRHWPIIGHNCISKLDPYLLVTYFIPKGDRNKLYYCTTDVKVVHILYSVAFVIPVISSNPNMEPPVLPQFMALYREWRGPCRAVLCYKSEGRWFDPRWCQWIFHWYKSFLSHYGPGVDSASNRNEYQEYFPGVKTAGA